MNFIDICAGIGGFRSGLERAGHKCIGWVEIDKYARKSYEEMYDTTGEWTAEDITKIEPEEIPESDIWCFGFPCQDISVAGKQRGLSGERSGIFYNIIGLLKSKDTKDKPEWLLVENVKNLLSIEGGAAFTEVLSEISETGYDTEWVLLNSKDFGVPQNRERVFIIGHLRERGRRKILSLSGTDRQTDSKTQTQQQTCKGAKESERQVDRFNHMIGNRKYQNSHVYGTNGVSRACDTNQEIYYAVPEIKTVIEGKHQSYNVQSIDGISRTVMSRDYKDPQKIAVPEEKNKINTLFRGPHQSDVIYGIDGVSRTLTSSEGGGIGNGVRTGLYAIPETIDDPKVKLVIPGAQATSVYDSEGVSVTLKAEGGGWGAKTGLYTVTGDIPEQTDKFGIFEYEGERYNIRRLTPRECFRLQGFTDEQFEKAEKVNSNSQLYKQAGNAVTVNVAEYLGNLINE